MKRAAVLLFTGLFAFPAACSDSSNPSDDDGTPPAPTFVGAPGVKLREVAMYQGLKRDLMLNGEGVKDGLPLVQGRDAVIRVFYDTDASYDGKEITARLSIDGQEPIEVKGTLGASSTDETIASTVNFVVPGDHVAASPFVYRIDLEEEGDTSSENAAARWPAEGTHGVKVDGAVNTFRVIIAPFQYNTDGSGRLPDTSDAAVEKYRTRLKQLYPVSNVEVSVHAVIPWNQPINPDGTGWEAVGGRVYSLRAADGASDDVYYYGLFKPEETFDSYCGFGCLLGVTLLNDQPPDTGDVGLRLALGVSYEEYTYDTMAHELGHAHGRMHADCGQGIDPASIDHNFPYPNGEIGVWGMDTATMTLYPPTGAHDIMGYCEDNWISDYNYIGLFNRAKNVNLPKWHVAENRRKVALLGVDGRGHATFTGYSSAPRDLGGRHLSATISDPTGRKTSAAPIFYPYDHMPGGMVLVPVEDERAAEISVEVDGVVHVAMIP